MVISMFDSMWLGVRCSAHKTSHEYSAGCFSYRWRHSRVRQRFDKISISFSRYAYWGNALFHKPHRVCCCFCSHRFLSFCVFFLSWVLDAGNVVKCNKMLQPTPPLPTIPTGTDDVLSTNLRPHIESHTHKSFLYMGFFAAFHRATHACGLLPRRIFLFCLSGSAHRSKCNETKRLKTNEMNEQQQKTALLHVDATKSNDEEAPTKTHPINAHKSG